ncbi:MAG: hypothetical protein VR77_08305 [Flavobacteriales bacterium BRH_c54]|nr:MAG: hypothetical protein VR77_08305 [Flavobacteriales bacterium BRH_c54]
MILVADSGSTKTDWRLINDKTEVLVCSTMGFNPYFVDATVVLKELSASILSAKKEEVEQVFFYGAGCSSAEKQTFLAAIFAQFFTNADITVAHDLLAAARAACKKESGLVAILGTGANTCLYNGTDITHNIPALGYILGDEGGGVHLGKLFIKKLLHGQLPDKVSTDFKYTFPELNLNTILDKVYKQALPNRFLASFAQFILKHENETEINAIIYQSFHEFFKQYIVLYPNYQQYPLHIVGSIGFYFQRYIALIAKDYGVIIGKIIQQPISELVDFHLKY